MIETKPPMEKPDPHHDPLGELLRAHESLMLVMNEGKALRAGRPLPGRSHDPLS